MGLWAFVRCLLLSLNLFCISSCTPSDFFTSQLDSSCIAADTTDPGHGNQDSTVLMPEAPDQPLVPKGPDQPLVPEAHVDPVSQCMPGYSLNKGKCQANACIATQVPGSNKAHAFAITGQTGDVVSISCNWAIVWSNTTQSWNFSTSHEFNTTCLVDGKFSQVICAGGKSGEFKPIRTVLVFIMVLLCFIWHKLFARCISGKMIQVGMVMGFVLMSMSALWFGYGYLVGVLTIPGNDMKHHELGLISICIVVICAAYIFEYKFALALWIFTTISSYISSILKKLEYDKKDYLNMLAHYGFDQFMEDLATGLATAKLTEVVSDFFQLRSELFGSIKERKNELANMAQKRILDDSEHKEEQKKLDTMDARYDTLWKSLWYVGYIASDLEDCKVTLREWNQMKSCDNMINFETNRALAAEKKETLDRKDSDDALAKLLAAEKADRKAEGDVIKKKIEVLDKNYAEVAKKGTLGYEEKMKLYSNCAAGNCVQNKWFDAIGQDTMTVSDALQTEPIRDKVDRFLQDSKLRSFVILGESGSGKSTCLQDLFQIYSKDSTFFVIYVDLPKHYKKDGNPVQNALFTPRKDWKAFNEDDINSMMELGQSLVQNFCFLLDGYDEIPGQENIWELNDLDKWGPNVKVITTCRTRRYQELKDSNSSFRRKVKDERGVPQFDPPVSVKTVYVSGLAPTTKTAFIERFVFESINKDLGNERFSSDLSKIVCGYMDLSRMTQEYVERLNKLSIPREMSNVPLTLCMILEVLPLAGAHVLTRAELYEKYTRSHFQRELGKLPSPKAFDIKVEDYQDYCERLSMSMHQYQKTKVNWSDQTKPKIENEWASFFRVVD